MAGPPVFFGSDRLERSVWVVVDPRDVVTGQRVSVPLRVRLEGIAAVPLVGRSGVYCFTDLNLPADNYSVQVQPLGAARKQYFDAEQDFALQPVPVPNDPLNRNLVSIDLFPRPAYPATAQDTLARGRLVTASDGSSIEGARVALILDTVDRGLRARTDERGEFVVVFPPPPPEDTAAAGLKDFKFQLRFEVESEPPFETAEETVREGSTFSLKEIEYPGT
jgi:hypothetical protein